MKKNYIQPQTMAQFLQGMHVICGSNPDLISGGPGDPKEKEVF